MHTAAVHSTKTAATDAETAAVYFQKELSSTLSEIMLVSEFSEVSEISFTTA